MHDILATLVFVTIVSSLTAGVLYAVDVWPPYETVQSLPQPWTPERG